LLIQKVADRMGEKRGAGHLFKKLLTEWARIGVRVIVTSSKPLSGTASWGC
jgi:hypothetical protein